MESGITDHFWSYWGLTLGMPIEKYHPATVPRTYDHALADLIESSNQLILQTRERIRKTEEMMDRSDKLIREAKV